MTNEIIKCLVSRCCNEKYIERLEDDVDRWKTAAESNVKMAAMVGQISDKNRCLEQKIRYIERQIASKDEIISTWIETGKQINTK